MLELHGLQLNATQLQLWVATMMIFFSIFLAVLDEGKQG